MISRIGLLKRPTVSTLNNYVKLQSTLALKRYTSTVPATSNQEQKYWLPNVKIDLHHLIYKFMNHN